MTENKYDPLRDHLKAQNQRELVLSYEQIEDIVGFGLPRSAQRAEWWDDDTPHHPRLQSQAIRQAGYSSRRLPDGTGVRFFKTSVFGY